MGPAIRPPTPSRRVSARWNTNQGVASDDEKNGLVTNFCATAATDIEHTVALAEAYDSRIVNSRRRNIAGDLHSLTISDPTVNLSQKGARDAAWFAERVI